MRGLGRGVCSRGRGRLVPRRAAPKRARGVRSTRCTRQGRNAALPAIGRKTSRAHRLRRPPAPGISPVGTMMIRVLFVLFALVAIAALLGLPSAVNAQPPKQPTAMGRGGAAATVDVLATDAAVNVLRDGGNAVDAAVAAAAVLGVTEPFSCGHRWRRLHGDLGRADGQADTIDHRETAPPAMRPDSFFESGAALPFNDARFSGLSVGVPGTVRGWANALERYGTMSLAEVLQPAIRWRPRVRDRSDVLRPDEATSTSSTTSQRPPPCSSTPTARPVTSAPCSATPTRADVPANRQARPRASTGARSPTRWSRRCRTRRSGRRQPRWRPGLMTMRDLQSYVAPERAPDARGLSGRRHVRHGTAVERRLDRSARRSTSWRGSTCPARPRRGAAPLPRGVPLLVRRSQRLPRGSDFVDVPLAGLLSDCFAAERRASSPRRRRRARSRRRSVPVPRRRLRDCAERFDGAGTTTHLTVSDPDGNVVSYTFTIESTAATGWWCPARGSCSTTS